MAAGERIKRRVDSKGEHRFTIRSANNEPTAVGEGYADEASRENGLRSTLETLLTCLPVAVVQPLVDAYTEERGI